MAQVSTTYFDHIWPPFIPSHPSRSLHGFPTRCHGLMSTSHTDLGPSLKHGQPTRQWPHTKKMHLPSLGRHQVPMAPEPQRCAPCNYFLDTR